MAAQVRGYRAGIEARSDRWALMGVEEQAAAVDDVVVTGARIDTFRLRSLVGLTVAFVAPRANMAVSGVLLTLLVTHRTSGAVAITVALTANRLIGWLAYPVLGRASDRTRFTTGRRVPYLAAGLLLMGVCTWGYTLVGGYWALVGLIVVVKTASVVFGLNNLAAVPETFGKSRTLKAVVAIAVLGTALSLAIKFTVIATWKTNVPATWNLPFRMAGGVMLVAALLVVVLVREASSVAELVDKDRRQRSWPWRSEVKAILAVPNSRVLLAGLFLFYSGFSATGYLAIVYFQRVQHAGASLQTVAGWITGVPALVVGIPLGYLISRAFTRKQVAVVTPIIGGLLLVVQYFTTHFWQSVVLAVVASPLLVALVMSLAPMLLQLLPRSGGVGEMLGKLVAPFTASAILFSFVAAWAVDATGSYRVIWLLPAAAYVAAGLLMSRLRIPSGFERMASMASLLDKMSSGVMDQVLSRGPERSLLGGEVTVDDADATSWFETARHVLGDPYAAEARRRSTAPGAKSTDAFVGPSGEPIDPQGVPADPLGVSADPQGVSAVSYGAVVDPLGTPVDPPA